MNREEIVCEKISVFVAKKTRIDTGWKNIREQEKLKMVGCKRKSKPDGESEQKTQETQEKAEKVESSWKSFRFIVFTL